MTAATPAMVDTEEERIEEERIRALHDLDLLDTEREPEFDELVSLASAICEVPMSVVSLLDANRQFLKAEVGVGVRETPRAIALCNYTIQQDDVMVVEDASADRRFADNPFVTGESHIRFYAGIPVSSPDGHKVGTLCVMDKSPKKLNNGQRTALRILGAQVSARIELRVQRKRLEQALVEAENANKRLETSEERFRAFMDSGPFVSYMKDQEGRLIFYNEPFSRTFRVSGDEWIGKLDAELWPPEFAAQFRREDVAVLNSGKLGVYIETSPAPDGGQLWWRSYKFPVTADDGSVVLGGVSVEVTDDLRREAELERSKRELELANQRLEEIASTDSLTGLQNRRAFDKRLTIDFSQSRRKERTMSVLLLDVDNFKRRNDTFGHPEGDATLKQLAQVLQGVARAADTVARYGGEEFAILLPETNEEQALQFAERVRNVMRETHWSHERVTASIGVASLHASMRDAQRLVSLADEALYVAKRAGKDRAVGYGTYFDQMMRETMNRKSNSEQVTAYVEAR